RDFHVTGVRRVLFRSLRSVHEIEVAFSARSNAARIRRLHGPADGCSSPRVVSRRGSNSTSRAAYGRQAALPASFRRADESIEAEIGRASWRERESEAL